MIEMLEWKGLGWFQSSLEEVAELTFDLETNFVDGKDVYRLFKEQKFEDLDNSSADEIMALINVHKGIKGEEFITEKSVSIKVLEDVKEVEQPLLQKLYNNNQITLDIKKEVEALVKSKKPTKKEKEHLFTILRGVYVRCDFVNKDQDGKKVIEQKEKEIKELLGL